MDAERRSGDLVFLVLVVGVVGMVIISGWQVLTDYRPVAGGEGLFAWEPPRSSAWFRMLLGVLAAAGVAAAIRFRHHRRALASAVVGALAAAIAGIFSALVLWEQVALAAVTVGSDIRGLWWPMAHADEVRFLIIDGAEVGVGTYQRWLLVNICAVVVACAALISAVWPETRDRWHQDNDELVTALD